jgi:hypothetical protein
MTLRVTSEVASNDGSDPSVAAERAASERERRGTTP